MSGPTDAESQTFTATSGRVTGVLGLATAAFLAVMFVLSAPASVAVPGVLACLFAAVVLWGAMLRPGVSVADDDLVMRTLFETVTIPLAGIDTVLVRRYLLVRAGGTKYVCPAIGRSLRKTVRSEMKWNGGNQMLTPGAAISQDSSVIAASQIKRQGEIDYPDYVEQRIHQLAAAARARRGIEERSEQEYELGQQSVRRIFWPVVVGLAVLIVAFVVALLAL
jgi:hypothetical protein